MNMVRYAYDSPNIPWPFGGVSGLLRDVSPIQKDVNGDYVLTVEVPGFRKNDLEIKIDGGVVGVRGSREGRSINQTYTLPRKAGMDAKAVLEHGVLKVVFPAVDTGVVVPID